MIEENLKKAIQKAILALQKKCKCNFEIPEIEITHPADTKFGDFSTNVAMKIANAKDAKPSEKKTQKEPIANAKDAKKEEQKTQKEPIANAKDAKPSEQKTQKNPLDIAENISKQLTVNSKQLPEIKDIQVVNPGFINFYLDESFLIKNAGEILNKKEKYGSANIGKGKNVLVDYSHPNIAKPIGIHHSMTTLIGDSIKYIYTFLGYKTIADNFLGDWGTQFGKTIYAYKKWGDKKTIEKSPIEEILKLYVRFHEEAEKDSKLEEEGRKEFKKLEDGDSENRKLWAWMREETLKELNKIYKELNIEFDYFNGEAFYEDKLPQILKELEKIGLLKEGKEKAKIIDLEKEGLGNALIQKGDGATLYLTRDIAAIKYRAKTFKPAQLLYVVEAKQEYHLAQLFEIAKKADYLGGAKPVHVKFGTMKFPEGGMSTRKGKLIYLWDVLEEAKARSLNVLDEKNSEVGNKKELSKIIGLGSVKYAVLSQNRLRDVTFTWDKMLSLDGNSAPYIMYSFVRCKSILEKSKVKSQKSKFQFKIKKLEKEELDLLRKLYLFPEVVEKAAAEYQPSDIANYIYELCQLFNTFYNKLPVLEAEEEKKSLRLMIVEATAQVIKNGMNLLNIELPEKM